MTLPHAIACVSSVIVGDISANRSKAGVIGELCRFQYRHRVVRLKGSSQMIRRMTVGTEELDASALLDCRELNASIDEPVPLIIGYIADCISRWIHETA